MGGSGGGGWSGSTGGGTWGGDGATGGAAGGGAAFDCPTAFKAALVGPAAGACEAGDILDVVFAPNPAPGRAICINRTTKVTVGSIGGIPGLTKLLECLQASVGYEAHVDKVISGRIDVTVRQV